jgi:putative membrane protein
MKDEWLGAERFSVDINAQTHFAWLRTRLAAERTFMAYARTAIALIGFGFTMYQFLARLSLDKSVTPGIHVNAPQWLGLLLIGTGIVFLFIGMWDYRLFVNYLHASAFKDVANKNRRWHTGTPLAAALLLVAGVFAFVSVLLRICNESQREPLVRARHHPGVQVEMLEERGFAVALRCGADVVNEARFGDAVLDVDDETVVVGILGKLRAPPLRVTFF